jgi:hypothetical protein
VLDQAAIGALGLLELPGRDQAVIDLANGEREVRAVLVQDALNLAEQLAGRGSRLPGGDEAARALAPLSRCRYHAGRPQSR